MKRKKQSIKTDPEFTQVTKLVEKDQNSCYNFSLRSRR